MTFRIINDNIILLVICYLVLKNITLYFEDTYN